MPCPVLIADLPLKTLSLFRTQGFGRENLPPLLYEIKLFDYLALSYGEIAESHELPPFHS